MNADKTSGAQEIFVFQNSKKTLAIKNNLNLAQMDVFSRIHNPCGKRGKGEDGYGYPSTMKITAIEKGVGKAPSKVLDFNLSPDEIRILFFRLNRLNKEVFQWSADRLHAFKKGADGRCPMQRITISRVPKDSSGADYRSPWFIKLSNGTAVPAENDMGGVAATKGSFKESGNITVMLSDDGYFTMLSNTVRFIELWENTYGSSLLKRGNTLVDIALAHNGICDEAGCISIKEPAAKARLIAIAYEIIERDVQTREVTKAYNELVDYMGTAVNTDYSAFKLEPPKAKKQQKEIERRKKDNEN